MTASLYIHVPFCAAFCDYCDFFSLEVTEDTRRQMDAFIGAVIADIRRQIEFFNIDEIPTVYIGGGTPSALGAKRIRVLLNALNALPGFSPLEFTVEANPESADEEFLQVCREGGVSRLSLGVQTFHEPSRRLVNRAGRADILDKRLSLVSRFFPDNFSADLIAGLPGQSEKIALEDIERLLEYAPAHVSLYSLSVESGTLLQRKIKSKEIALPARDEADAIWLAGRDALKDAGFQHYEVSNFARPEKRSLHNIRYWLMKSWFAAGPAASATIVNEEKGTAKRCTYPADLDAYLQASFPDTAVCEDLDRAALKEESLLMGYRYCEGPDAAQFRRRFGVSIEDCIPQTLARWKEKDKLLFLNGFLREAFLELGE